MMTMNTELKAGRMSGRMTGYGSLPDREMTAGLPALVYYWRIALRWKFVIAGIMAGVLLLALVVTLLMTPRYTASSTIEIAREQNNIANVRGVEPSTSSLDQEFYQTQYGLLRARTLAEHVATKLKLAQDDKFFATFRVDPDDVGTFGRAPMDAASLEKRKRKAVDILLDNVGVSPDRASKLVTLSFTSADPNLAVRVVNGWSEGFIEMNLDRRFDATAYARRFLENRLEQLRQKLEESERQLVDYASRQRIINVQTVTQGAEGNDRVERSLDADDLVALNQALAQATADRIAAESRARNSGGDNALALENEAINAIRQKRAEAAAAYANMMTKFAPEYPSAVALAAQISRLDQSITREEARVRGSFSSTYQQALARERGLQQRVNELKTGMLDLRRRSIQYNIYQREVDTNRQLYDGLLQRYKEIGVAGGVGVNNVSIVDPAIAPRKPTSPRLLLNLAIALLLGAALAVAAVYALEQIDETIKDPADFKRTIGIPLLGAIPLSAEGEPLENLLDRKSSISEAYLAVQTNLQFATDHGVPRSFAITSSRPAEGKSTSAFALAQSLARTGRSVILIDGDMRSPSVHKLLQIENKGGTSNFLAGDDAIDTFIAQGPLPNFSILPAGPQPPNAAELLSGSRFSALIERLLSRYDHVVIDAPPVIGLADAPLIASQIEGIIYAIEAGGARSSLIRTAMARLNSPSTNLIGAVLTKFNANKAHYGYGYDYGYGYGKNDPAAA